MGSSSPQKPASAAAGAAVAPPPAPSNFGDFVQRFAWACLLRPGGVKMALKDDEDSGGAESSESSEDQWVSGGKARSGGGGAATGGGGGAAKLSSKSKSSSFKETKEEDNDHDSFHEAEWESTASAATSAARIHALESAIGEVFATVSALKSAYIQLQAAHSPFDPEKLRLADKAVIQELRRLSEMKHGFRDQQRLRDSSSTLHQHLHQHHHHNGRQQQSLEEHNEELRRKIQELATAAGIKQRAMETYEARVRACEAEIEQQRLEIDELNDNLARAVARREKLERRLRKCEQRSSANHHHHHHHRQGIGLSSSGGSPSILEGSGGGGGLLSSIDASPTPQIFEVAVQNARESALAFSKLLVSLMRGVQWDLEAAAESIEAGIGYARPAHRRFAFESYVCHRIFCGFENENFYINGSLSSILDPVKHRAECFRQFRDMRAVDPADLLGITPECLFGKFCHRKYLQIVHEKMEESFFGGFEQHRDVILDGGHPRTRFYQSFLRFAKAVWLVHRLAFSFEPTATIFQVKRGTEFDPAFMESAARNVRMSDDDDGVRPRVGFTVMPGFRVDKWIVKCHVYLDGMVASED
ncbi:protein GRAVITROPIC IN THE LIGHT 1 [Selaginella moellendorffii]|nr:protein GRAVITROPIC IN THE LIGHT 1 [Selaginella moellendorffii]|eukprot:XP_002963441.2 protein GRAVITROPIC IN THE LIGHT 1 [Selaginella moellendorffii]